MNQKMWFGLILLAGSYGQLLLPRRLFDHPSHFFFGYAFIPGNLLACSTALFALGIIVLSEGVCERFGGASLWRFATREPGRLAWLPLTAGAAGLAFEFFAQWLGKLWVYPYWTVWFYCLVVLPGFVFYWISIAESYLAVKAVLDAHTGPHPIGRPLFPFGALGFLGALSLVAVAWLYLRWYAAHGGYVFIVTRPAPSAPPFAYVLLALLGLWCVAEWALHRRGRPSLLRSALERYWNPAAAILGSSLGLAMIMETQNAAHRYWLYTHFPGADLTMMGVQLSVFATWPLQYLAFLLPASVLMPSLAPLLWKRGSAGGV